MKTVIYFFAGLLVLSSGVIILLAWPKNIIAQSIATSLVAGGIASVAFTAIRYFDESDSRKRTENLQVVMQKVNNGIVALKENRIVIDNVSLRCVFKHQLTEEFTEMVQRVPTEVRLVIDIIGFSLIRFYTEQLKRRKLITDRPMKLRIIVQDPRKEDTRMMAEQEARNLDTMRDDILRISRYIINKNQEQNTIKDATKIEAKILNPIGNMKSIDVELRWFTKGASLTMVRINDVIYVRPRFIHEGKDAPVFFEQFRESDGLCFESYKEYFQHAWNMSKSPTLIDCNRVARELKDATKK